MFERHNSEQYDEFEFARRQMVERQICERGISNARVLAAMIAVPRHAFVLPEYLEAAYTDRPLPLGEEQTISQPYMVAAMADALALTGDERVLEIGAGSGYQAAVLSVLAREVITVETNPLLAQLCRERLARLGYTNVRVFEGDGSLGLAAEAPFDAILVSAAAPSVPQPLVDQLADSGCLAIPVGDSESQQVLRITKHSGEIRSEKLYHCRFVPLVGQYGWSESMQEASRG